MYLLHELQKPELEMAKQVSQSIYVTAAAALCTAMTINDSIASM